MQTAQKQLKYYKKPDLPKKRTVKIDGNVAYIDSGFAKKKVVQTKTAAPKKKAATSAAKPKKKTTAAAKPAKKQVKRGKGAVISTLALCFVAFCALALLISRYAAVYAIGAQNNELENSIAQTQAEIEALQVDMELRDDIEYIKNTARDELKMTYPTQDQKVTIDLSS